MKLCFVVRSTYHQSPTYTTAHLAFDALCSGHDVYFTNVNQFNFSSQRKFTAVALKLPSHGFKSRELMTLWMQQLSHQQWQEIPIENFDVVFLRYNPNDLRWESEIGKCPILEFTHFLQDQGTMVINSPLGLEKAASKFYLSTFPEQVRPKSLVTRSAQDIKTFIASLNAPVIIKPLNGFGGNEVFFVESFDDINLNQIVASVTKNSYAVAQQYIPAHKNDKRVLLWRGQPILIEGHYAVFGREPARGDIRSNIQLGATTRQTSLTQNELHMLELIRPKLIEDGLYFVGADILGEKIIELNVFCSGGINPVNELYSIKVGQHLIDQIDKTLSNPPISTYQSSPTPTLV